MTKLVSHSYFGVYGKCRDCGSDVSHYGASDELIELRPEADEEDYWAACDNDACPNHYGEGIFQYRPEWEESLPDKDVVRPDGFNLETLKYE